MTTSGWLGAMWPVVGRHLPPAPARVVEIGCGPVGGFVPFLLEYGYEAVGVDPKAPNAAHYARLEFESFDSSQRFDAAIACTSLHHARDPGRVLDQLGTMLSTGGRVVVVEWAWERFDGATAQWCFARIGEHGSSWLHRHRDEWVASGREWDEYLHSFARHHGLHSAQELLRVLDERLERQFSEDGPYFFADLPGVTDAEERAAIEAGAIQPVRIDWVGIRR